MDDAERLDYPRSSKIINSGGLLDFLQATTSRSRIKSSRQEIFNRASNSIRELSESNRLKSQDKIKNEEMCFRFKLKMITILRQIKFDDAEIESLEKLQAENFMLSFTHKLKNYLKGMERSNESYNSKIKAYEKIVE